MSYGNNNRNVNTDSSKSAQSTQGKANGNKLSLTHSDTKPSTDTSSPGSIDIGSRHIRANRQSFIGNKDVLEDDMGDQDSASESVSPYYMLASYQNMSMLASSIHPGQEDSNIGKASFAACEPKTPNAKNDAMPSRQPEVPNLNTSPAEVRTEPQTSVIESSANKKPIPKEPDEIKGSQQESYDREKAMLDKNKSYDNYGEINFDAGSDDTLTTSLENPIVYNPRFRSCKRITYEQHKGSMTSPHNYQKEMSIKDDIDGTQYLSYPRVLVIGGESFLGMHVIKELIKLGRYRVRTTVCISKSAKKLDMNHIVKILRSFKHAEAGPTLHIIKAHAMVKVDWKAVVCGCDKIILTTGDMIPYDNPTNSELWYTFSGPKKTCYGLIQNYAKANQLIFDAAKTEPTVKKIVVTSSISTIVGNHESMIEQNNKRSIFSLHTGSKDFNLIQENNLPDDQNKMTLMTKSKIMCERIAFRYMNHMDGRKCFDLLFLNCSDLIGPSLCYGVESPFANTFRRIIRTKGRSIPNLATNMIDVRDVALAHIMALYDSPNLKRRNLLTTTGGPYPNEHFSWYDIAQIIQQENKNQEYQKPTRLKFATAWCLAKFDPMMANKLPLLDKKFLLPCNKIKELFNIDPTPIRFTISDMLERLHKCGSDESKCRDGYQLTIFDALM